MVRVSVNPFNRCGRIIFSDDLVLFRVYARRDLQKEWPRDWSSAIGWRVSTRFCSLLESFLQILVMSSLFLWQFLCERIPKAKVSVYVRGNVLVVICELACVVLTASKFQMRPRCISCATGTIRCTPSPKCSVVSFERWTNLCSRDTFARSFTKISMNLFLVAIVGF